MATVRKWLYNTVKKLHRRQSDRKGGKRGKHGRQCRRNRLNRWRTFFFTCTNTELALVTVVFIILYTSHSQHIFIVVIFKSIIILYAWNNPINHHLTDAQ